MDFLLVPINVRGQDYITDLQKRLKEGKINQHQLAREMTRLTRGKKVIDAPQVSRWLHRRVRPNLTSIELIEKAVANLTKKK